MEQQDPQTTWPAVDVAYQFIVKQSYDWMIGRVNNLDQRIQSVQTLIVTVVFAVPAFSKVLNTSADYQSGYFLAGTLAAIAAIVVGVIARTEAGVILISRPAAWPREWKKP